MKPKMQLAPGSYVSDAFRAEINAWMLDFFGYEEEEKEHVFDDANIVTTREPIKKASNKVARTKRARRTQLPPDMESFTALLAGLDDSFYSLQVPAITGSFLTRREITAIKKLGIYIPVPATIEFMNAPSIANDIGRPMIASALLYGRKAERGFNEGMGKNDWMLPRFTYAIKGVRLPESVEATKGVPYQFGVCFELKHDEAGKDMKPKMWWAWCWLVIKPDGSLRIPHEKRRVTTVIKAAHKGKNKAPRLAVTNTAWCMPSLAVAETGVEQSMHEQYMLSTFRQLLTWWAHREQKWSVGVRRDGHRVTFGIAKEHTASYFADRDTVVNVNGKPKKIVHFVNEHTRVSGSVVKAHVRGLREFDWRGYSCAVTAPDLKGAIFTNFLLDPLLIDRKDKTEDFIEIDAIAERLATLEDTVN